MAGLPTILTQGMFFPVCPLLEVVLQTLAWLPDELPILFT